MLRVRNLDQLAKVVRRRIATNLDLDYIARLRLEGTFFG